MSLAMSPLTLHVGKGSAGTVADGDGVGVGVGVSLGLGEGDDDGTGLLEEGGVGVALLVDEDIELLEEEVLGGVAEELVLREVLDEVVPCCFDVEVDDLLDVVEVLVDVLLDEDWPLHCPNPFWHVLASQ
jgi:hypothetical protein